MVKTNRYLLIGLLLGLALSVNAQSLRPYLQTGRARISFDLFTGIIGRLPLSSEYGLVYHERINERMEWSERLAYNGRNFLLAISPGPSSLRLSLGINGVSTGGTWKYFLNPRGRRVWFVGTELNYAFARLHSKREAGRRADLSKLTAAPIIGYRLFLSSGLEVDAFFGVGVSFRNYFWGGQTSSRSNPSPGQPVNAAWRASWGLTLGNKVGWAVPIGLRLGYRF